MPEQTKSQQIMNLYAHGILSDREIAEKVGCHQSYVRVVARQRYGLGTSHFDRKYRQRDDVKRKNAAWQRAYRHRQKARRQTPHV